MKTKLIDYLSIPIETNSSIFKLNESKTIFSIVYRDFNSKHSSSQASK